MAEATPPASTPMGRLDAFDAGSTKLTVQTEFFYKPGWRVETKIYAAGALKKVYTDDLSQVPETDLQRRIDQWHHDKVVELRERLSKMSSGSPQG